MVARIAKGLRKSLNLQDNLFLDRYAHSVTNNGEIINQNSTEDIGYGVWRLTKSDFDQILNEKLSNQKRIRYARFKTEFQFYI